MAKAVTIKHPPSGLVKTGYVGFSWTYLFFGPLVPLVRGEVGIAVLHFIARHRPAGERQLLLGGAYRLSYLPYDWDLNRQSP